MFCLGQILTSSFPVIFSFGKTELYGGLGTQTSVPLLAAGQFSSILFQV